MDKVFFITHPDVVIDPATPVPEWRLDQRGLTRMRAMLARDWVAGIVHVVSSAERKARDGADILAAHLGLSPVTHPGLGENDRSSTGYLPRPEFDSVVDVFFAKPGESVRGWERAVDAQARIVAAIEEVLREAPAGDVAIVSHGGVGALLLCHLRGMPISRAAGQPSDNGGHVMEFDRATWRLRHGWRPIEV